MEIKCNLFILEMNKHSFALIAEPFNALDEVWIIGDAFVTKYGDTFKT